jgi:hypothetical protein
MTTEYINAIIQWFSGLSDSPQLDDQVVMSFATLRDWFVSLSLNQQLVVLLLLFCCVLVVFGIYRGFRVSQRNLRLWYRRKRIPKSIDLHLDRDASSKESR